MAPIYPPSSAQAERTTLSDEVEQEGYELYDNQQEIEYEGYELRSFGQRDQQQQQQQQQQQRQHDTADRLAPSPRVPSRISGPSVPSRRSVTSTSIPEQATAQQTTDNAWNAALQATGGDWSHDSTAHRLGAIPRAERRRTSTELPQHVTAVVQALNESVSSRLRSRTQRPRQEPVVAGPSSGPQFERLFGGAASPPPRQQRAKKPAAKKTTAKKPAPQPKGKGKQRAVDPESDDNDDSDDDEQDDAGLDAATADPAELMPSPEDDLMEGDHDAEFDQSDQPVESDEDAGPDGNTSGQRGPARRPIQEVRQLLGMLPSAAFVSRDTADIDSARFAQRVADLVNAARREAGSQPGRDFKDWSFAPTINWPIHRSPDGYLAQQMLAGVSPEVAEVLGREQISIDDLLSLPCRVESMDQLDSHWIVYINITVERRADGTVVIGIYIGSASGQDRSWPRLRQYVRFVVTGHTDEPGIHAGLVADGETTVNFRVLWARPMANSTPIMPLIMEGMFQTLFGVVAATREDGSRVRYSNDRIRAFCQNNGFAPGVLPPFRQLNFASALRQGCGRHRNFADKCTICGQSIQSGEVGFAATWGPAGLGRAHWKCFTHQRVREQRREFPDACNTCCQRGVAATCDKSRPHCNNCADLSRAHRCSYKALGYNQDLADKCETCKRRGSVCDGGAPCGYCAKWQQWCSNGGNARAERRTNQPMEEKCKQCKGPPVRRCDGKTPCGTCKKYGRNCSNQTGDESEVPDESDGSVEAETTGSEEETAEEADVDLQADHAEAGPSRRSTRTRAAVRYTTEEHDDPAPKRR